MKNVLLTAAMILAMSTGSAFAQSASNDLDSRVASVTRDMSVKLGLNESEYIKLKNINREKLVKADEITTMYKNDISMRNAKLTELQNNYDSQLRTFLNNKQLDAYASYKVSNKSFMALEDEQK